MNEGTEQYNLDQTVVKARGSYHNDQELDSALSGSVRDILLDSTGSNEVVNSLSALAKTGFSSNLISQIAANTAPLSKWRVGEALAESFLTRHRQCLFPWPFTRDQRNPASSEAGADLVGFHNTPTGYRFAFGEAKTSEQQKSPPDVMESRTGLAGQLRTLRDNIQKRHDLVKYLTHRKTGSSWEVYFDTSAERYMRDTNDISLFGLLIRDTVPNPSDLRAKSKSLDKDCPSLTSIELRAIYLPQKCLKDICRRAQTKAGM